ncbi:MAG: ATP-dependent sacrificial sulfur transferase LarE [Syntrophaceae bacterium]
MIDTIIEAIAQKEKLAVMLSGGLDSAVLAKLAHEALGEKSLAITIESPIVAFNEIEDAMKIAREIGVAHEIIPMNELDDREFATNQPNRCYICRKLRNRAAREVANEFAIETLADGINHDDLKDYRPGKKAADEDNIWHPFVELKLSKQAVRQLARDLKLTLSDKHSEACLCSRIAYGVNMNQDLLERIEKAETFLKNVCQGPLRVRCLPYDLAMIDAADQEGVMRSKDKIVSALREFGFAFVCLDLEGFVSGKLNRIIA